MKGHKYCIIILSSFTLVACLFLSSTHRSQPGQEFLGTRTPAQRVDGGGPVPPLPPKPFLKTLTADGGRPVPPLPPKPFRTLISEEGRPLPPLPPPPPHADLLPVS